MKRIINNYLYGLANPSKISYLTFYVNNNCQLRCSMCFYWDSMQKKNYTVKLRANKKNCKIFTKFITIKFNWG